MGFLSRHKNQNGAVKVPLHPALIINFYVLILPNDIWGDISSFSFTSSNDCPHKGDESQTDQQSRPVLGNLFW